MFAQASEKDWMRILCTLNALEIGNRVFPEDSVQTNRVLPGHQVVYNLQHRSIEGRGVM